MKSFKEFLTEIFSADDVKVANSTSRNTGAVGANALVPKYVLGNVSKSADILDFGAGKAAAHALRLRDDGFSSVTAYEFGSNAKEGLHDKEALSKKYDVVYASNVMNVQNSAEMLDMTIKQVKHSLRPGGEFIFNLPLEPRKGAWATSSSMLKNGSLDDKKSAKTQDIATLEKAVLKYFSSMKRVGGTNIEPLMVAK